MTDARAAFATRPCIYVQADPNGRPIRVGKAAKGLARRYWGGTGHALDAAMDGSGNLVFVAPLASNRCARVESQLIWQHRKNLKYNKQHPRHLLEPSVKIRHEGEAPKFGRATG